MKLVKKITFILPYLILGLLPSLNLSTKLNFKITQLIVNLVNYLAFFLLWLLLIRIGQIISKKITIFFITLASIYYWLIAFLIIYWNYTKNIFNIYFYLDSFQDIKTTSNQIFSTTQIIFFSLLLIILIVFFLMFFRHYSKKQITSLKFSHQFIILFFLFIIIFSTHSHSFHYLKNQYNAIVNAQQIRREKLVEFPNNEIYQTKANDSIFILQLESGNGIILNGDLPNFPEIYYPNIKKISADGILFPRFWSNSIQTNRAQANILCGIYSNHNEAYSYNPQKINVECLPEILKKQGYTTIYFRSSDLSYTNLGNFAREIGFEEVFYDEIMQPNDKKYGWGYDDCIFYQRAFQYLKKNYPNNDKLLVYFEVSSHHYPFEPKQQYQFVQKFNDDENFQKKYLNSFLAQDYCVSEFYQNYQNYNQNNNSHLFILPDTSWPVDTHNNIFNEKNSYNDNFLTFLSYLPPKNKRNNFKINHQVNKIYSQTDLMPTIFEILNGKNYPNSFAFEIFKNYDKNYQYEDCHILTQPYGGTEITIINNMQKYIYNFQNNLITHFDLKTDWLEKNPKMINSKNFSEFKNKYFCQRFK